MIDFPSNPSINQIYSYNGYTWQWNGSYWRSNNLSQNFLSLSGGTVTGPTNFTGGLSANTISATTYFNLPKDVFVTGGTYSAGTATFTNNTGGTFDVTGFFTGNTMTGQTSVDFGFTGGGESDYSYTVVSKTNILQSSMVIYTVISSNDHQQTEDSLLDGLTFKTSDIIDGVSFTVNCYSLNNTWGSYNVFYKIIN